MNSIDEKNAIDEKPHPVIRTFITLSSGFWLGKSAKIAWVLTAGIFVSLAAQLATQVGINVWNRVFFDALEQKSVSNILASLTWLPFLIIAFTLSATCLLVVRMTFQKQWRQWLTNRIAGWWIADQRYYRLSYIAPEQSAPEYRIADDVRL